MLDFETALAGRRVLVTGHTGFTGGWITLWLKEIGCEVSGLALPPQTKPNLFEAAGIDEFVDSVIADIRDYENVSRVFDRCRPEIVLHLAAQPLVSRSFDDPVETIATNVMGTAHVLEAARLSRDTAAVVCVTTDKVYADRASSQGHRETDRLGGKDTYSASKAAAELIVESYIASMCARGSGFRVATARGGNIIGGGDWSADRIVPDFVRAVNAGAPLVLRRPDAVRPWQHVLALVHGYLCLAARLSEGHANAVGAWNFGPLDEDAKTVRTLVESLADVWRGPRIDYTEAPFLESEYLRVESNKARDLLGWRPSLRFSDAVALTANWYDDFYARRASARELTQAQIASYRSAQQQPD